MDEMMWLRMFGGGFGSGVDLCALLAFVAFAMVSFLAPVIGYRPRRPAGVTVSLYLLIGYVGVSAVQLLVQVGHALDQVGSGSSWWRGEFSTLLLVAFALLKLGLLLAAMLSFTVGLHSLRLRGQHDED